MVLRSKKKMDVLKFVLAIVFVGLPGSSTSKSYRDASVKGNLKTEIVCEANMAVLSCTKPGEAIRVESLFYGRKAGMDSICNKDSIRQETCEMTGSDKKEKEYNLARACDGQTKCGVIAADFTFGDRQKCPRTNKYLHIIYACEINFQTTTNLPTSTIKQPITKTKFTPNPPSKPWPTRKPATTPTPPKNYSAYRNKLDENGQEWPKPRSIKKCNLTFDVDDDLIEDFNSAASYMNFGFHVVIVTLALKVFLFEFLYL